MFCGRSSFLLGQFSLQIHFSCPLFLIAQFNTFVFRFNSGTCSSELIVFLCFPSKFFKIQIFTRCFSRRREPTKKNADLAPPPSSCSLNSVGSSASSSSSASSIDGKPHQRQEIKPDQLDNSYSSLGKSIVTQFALISLN